jgi:hypothetical protein
MNKLKQVEAELAALKALVRRFIQYEMCETEARWALKDHLAGCAVCQEEWEADKARASRAVMPEVEK